jgi:maltose alpha-D-glucosyltransferase/alpha-amylase
MVTDEEREYMYHAYAKDKRARINLGIRRRLMPLLENDRGKIELFYILLLTLPGTPILYYGDEIGMGDNFFLGDRNGCRTPMQWSSATNAGFSHANPQQLYLPVITDPAYHYITVNVENQEQNRSSLLRWIKTVLALRKQSTIFGRGKISFLSPDNPKIMAFIRSDGAEQVAVVINLSQQAQRVDLDLSAWQGVVPEELFSRNRFPPIQESPYVMTLGPYGYYILSLRGGANEPQRHVAAGANVSMIDVIPEMVAINRWEDMTQDSARAGLEAHLPTYLQGCRWFAGKGRHIRAVEIIEQIPIGQEDSTTWLTLVTVHYRNGPSENYQIPIAFAKSDTLRNIGTSHAIICRIKIGQTDGIIYDGVYDKSFQKNLLLAIEREARIKGEIGALFATHGEAFEKGMDRSHFQEGNVLKTEQSNTSILYGNQFILKLYRKIEEGMNPDLEIGRYLQNYAKQYAPLYAGTIEYRPSSSQSFSELVVIGILHRFIPNKGDGWSDMLNEVKRYMERVSADGTAPPHSVDSKSPLTMADDAIGPIAQDSIGKETLEKIALLGKRTAELHLALANNRNNPDFAPEPFSTLYQRSIYQSFQGNTKKRFHFLRQNIKELPEGLQENARCLLAKEDECYKRYRPLLDHKISAMRIRIHGDYHLGQVLFTGNDFIPIDFEGEPARPLYERRLKRSPLRDVAGMLRSFHYVVSAGLLHGANASVDASILQSWADFWYAHVSGAFLRSYIDTVAKTPLIPKNPIDLAILLNAFLLERALYELWYEINHRPDWVQIPIRGILSILSIDERVNK